MKISQGLSDAIAHFKKDIIRRKGFGVECLKSIFGVHSYLEGRAYAVSITLTYPEFYQPPINFFGLIEGEKRYPVMDDISTMVYFGLPSESVLQGFLRKEVKNPAEADYVLFSIRTYLQSRIDCWYDMKQGLRLFDTLRDWADKHSYPNTRSKTARFMADDGTRRRDAYYYILKFKP